MAKILIAEDEKDEREWLCKYIREHHRELEIVAECSNGKDALESSISLSPDILFLDIEMPLMTGLEVADKLATEDKQQYFVFLTAHSKFDYAQKAVKVGAFDYLLKPYSPTEIDTLIHRLLATMEKTYDDKLDDLITHMANATPSENQNPVVRLALEYIEDHYSDKISLEILSSDIGFSTGYVSKCLIKYVGKNFNTILLEKRCYKALDLLREDRLTVNEISDKVGFTDPGYFTKCFKALFGTSPKRYSNILMGKK